jgi:hypothetical protein
MNQGPLLTICQLRFQHRPLLTSRHIHRASELPPHQASSEYVVNRRLTVTLETVLRAAEKIRLAGLTWKRLGMRHNARGQSGVDACTGLSAS